MEHCPCSSRHTWDNLSRRKWALKWSLMRFCLFLRESRWIPELFQNHFLRFPSLPVIRAHYGDTLQLGFYGENDFPVEFPPPQHLNPHSDISFPVLHNPCTLQRIHLGQILPPVILGCWGGWIRKTSSIRSSSKRFWEYRNISKIKIIAVLNCGAESNTWVLVHPDFLGVLLQELPEHSWFHPKIHSWFHPKIHSWFSQRAANPGNSPKEGN